MSSKYLIQNKMDGIDHNVQTMCLEPIVDNKPTKSMLLAKGDILVVFCEIFVINSVEAKNMIYFLTLLKFKWSKT